MYMNALVVQMAVWSLGTERRRRLPALGAMRKLRPREVKCIGQSQRASK